MQIAIASFKNKIKSLSCITQSNLNKNGMKRSYTKLRENKFATVKLGKFIQTEASQCCIRLQMTVSTTTIDFRII